MKKNILFIIESSETGGAETMFAELVQRVDRQRYIPHVALLYEGWLVDRLKSDGISPHMIPNRKGGFDFQLLQGISSCIKRNDIDLIHSHLFTTNVYACLCGAMAGIPVISTFHGTMDVDSGDCLKKLKWLIINRFSHRIVFVSHYLKEYFISQKLANEHKSQVIYNGICMDRFRHSLPKAEARGKLGLSDSTFVVGCVGDLRPAKDYKNALLAMSLLKKVIPDFQLIVAGTKTEMLSELEILCNSLRIAECVQFLGHRSDIENVFPAFDVYLSTSTSEGFSLTVVEAMAAGLPVVATRSGGPEEIICHGETGLLVDVGEAEKIADAIEYLYRDRDACAVLGRTAACKIETKFSIHSMVDSYQALFGEMSHTETNV